jgi:hypothetical protein
MLAEVYRTNVATVASTRIVAVTRSDMTELAGSLLASLGRRPVEAMAYATAWAARRPFTVLASGGSSVVRRPTAVGGSAHPAW